jgi:hypothetical protein
VKILELFSGSKSFSNVAKEFEYETFTVDFEKETKPDYCINILEFDYNKIPFKPDIIWASPPCKTFSVASIGHHWFENHTPKTKEAEHGMEIVLKTIEIIKQYNPKYFYIENPVGKLRKLYFMQEFFRNTVTYCQYGDKRRKPTDIWTNNLNWWPKRICQNGASCHVSAPAGSGLGTESIKDYYEKAKVPYELCKEILENSK